MLHISRLSTTPIRSLIHYAIFSQAGLPRRVYYLAPLWENKREVFQAHNNALHSSETEPRVDNLAIANMSSYPLSCTAASWDDCVKCLFPRTQQRVMPSVGIELAILQLLFGALGDRAAITPC